MIAIIEGWAAMSALLVGRTSGCCPMNAASQQSWDVWLRDTEAPERPMSQRGAAQTR